MIRRAQRKRSFVSGDVESDNSDGIWKKTRFLARLFPIKKGKKMVGILDQTEIVLGSNPIRICAADLLARSMREGLW